MKRISLQLIALMFVFACGNALNAQTYTFTTAGASGSDGPTQFKTDSTYLGTNLEGEVETLGGIQYWVVPSTQLYSIAAYGAQGYGDFGGRGALMIGEFTLTMGDTLQILVGQKAPPYLDYPATTYNHQFGGGGGSFVVATDSTPYIVAGGGGGNHGATYYVECDGQITTNGAAGTNGSILGAGGTLGSGGLSATSADAGGGLLTNGDGIAGGFAFINGGAGGHDEGFGGFGGGGGTSSWNNYRGGGGGGYSGGGGANNSSTCCPSGGGGGSYNAGTNQNNLAGVQLGNGLVVITVVCVPTLLTADSTLLPDLIDECEVTMPVAPTATNDCGQQVSGTPNVSFPVMNQGLTVVTWTFTDGTNTITQNQNVILDDVTSPVPDSLSLPDSTYWCSVDSLIAPTATDNCSGVTVTNDATLPILTAGLTVVTWTFTDSAGNSTTQTQNITLDALDNGISLVGTQLDASGLGYQYQWLDCNNGNAIIPGAINQSFVPTSTGYYAVQVTFNGCVDTSACVLVEFAGIDDYNKNQMKIYPNPSSDGIFTVVVAGEIKEVQLIDLLGKTFVVNVDRETNQIDASSFVSGTYTVRVVTNETTYTKELILLK